MEFFLALFLDIIVFLISFRIYLFFVNKINLNLKYKIFFYIAPFISVFIIVYGYIDRQIYIKNNHTSSFNGFLLDYSSKRKKKEFVTLVEAMKNYKKIKYIDIITGYKTDYISINNKNNIQNSTIIRLYQSTIDCLKVEELQELFAIDKINLNGLCLNLKEISYQEVSLYQFSPEVLRDSKNTKTFYFIPFLHISSDIFSAISKTNRKTFAVLNSDDENSIVSYSSQTIYLGTFQKYIAKNIKPTNKEIIDTFMKTLY